MEEKQEKNRNWGGARKGAGRKKIGGCYCYFRALPEVETILNALKDSKTDYINAAILAYSKQMKQ